MRHSTLLRPFVRASSWIAMLMVCATAIAMARSSEAPTTDRAAHSPHPGRPGIESGEPAGRSRAVASCSPGDYTSIWQCSSNAIVVTSSTTTRTFEIFNDGDRDAQYDFSCDWTGAISACSVTSGHLEVPAGESRPFSLTFTAGNAGSGSVTVLAQDRVMADEASAIVNVTVIAATVLVAPDTVSITVADGSSTSYVFQVTNTRTARDTFNLSAVCSGGVTCAGAPAPATLALNSGATGAVPVSFSTGPAGGTGVVKLIAARKSMTANKDSGRVNVVIVPTNYGVAVTTTSSSITHPAAQPGSHTFAVENTGNKAATFALSAACDPGFTTCSVSPSTISNLAVGSSASATLSFTTGGPGSGGTIQLTAAQGLLAQESRPVSVTVPLPASGHVVSVVHPGTRLERSVCLNIAMHGASAECGDLRLGHALPSTMRRTRTHTPRVTYNSQHAHPFPTVSADVTLGTAQAAPDSIVAILSVNGAPVDTGRWAGAQWAPGQTRRITLGFDALAPATQLGSGIHPYGLEVTAVYGSTRQPESVTGEFVVVNRKDSPFGAGWWLAGVDTLNTSTMLVIAGDGSTRQYVPAGADQWVARSIDYPDTLRWDGSRYTRFLPGGIEVRYDASGLHVATLNRFNDSTVFGYNGGRLESITLPAHGTTTVSYLLAYSNGKLWQVNAPANRVAGLPVYRRTNFSIVGGLLTTITDRDGLTTRFDYDGPANLITSRTDRGGDVTTFAYDATGKVLGDSIDPGHEQEVIRRRIYSIESRSLAPTSLRLDSAVVVYDGPRDSIDVADSTRFHLASLGQVTSIRDAHGNVTELVYGDPRWPAAVTELRPPLGSVQRAVYNSRGNITRSIVVDPFDDGQGDAITRYEYTNASWPDFATRTVTPTNDSIVVEYDANGNRDWQQDGRGPASRIDFRYYADHLLRVIDGPLAPPESLTYDPNGNLQMVETPLDFRTYTHRDSIGRDTLTILPIDGSLTRQVRTSYTSMDQVHIVTDSGPAMPGATWQRLRSEHAYTPLGALQRLKRWDASDADPTGIDVITTEWEYDNAGRRIAEIAPDDSVDRTWYDGAGNPIRQNTRRHEELDEQFVTMTYDALSRLTKRVLPEVSYAARLEGLPTHPNAPYWHANIVSASGPDSAFYVQPYPQYPNDGGTGYLIAKDSALYAYDDAGRLTSAINSDAQVSRTYYPNGQLRTETQKLRTTFGDDFDTHTYVIENKYDLSGRRVELIHPGELRSGASRLGTSWTYAPGWGALETVTDVEGNVFQYTYKPDGMVHRLERPNNINDEFTFDHDGRLIRHTTSNDTTEADFPWPQPMFRDATYTYDKRGKLRFVDNDFGTGDDVESRYSGLGHLVYHSLEARMVNIHGNIGPYVTVETYAYDALGNFVESDGQRTVDTRTEWHLDRSHAYSQGVGRLVRMSDGTNSRVDTTTYDAAGNVIWMTQHSSSSGENYDDRASFYGANEKLRATDARQYYLESGGGYKLYYRAVFEEHRYDALGRRVWTRARRWCEGHDRPYCTFSKVRRVVWDGEQELYEIQMPDDAQRENDTAPVVLGDASPPGGGELADPLPFYGRVAYTPGIEIDQPVSIVRFGYKDQVDWYFNTAFTPRALAPFTIMPLWSNGEAGVGVFEDGGIEMCEHQTSARCVLIQWSGYLDAYQREQITHYGWFGDVLNGKRDASGTMYRRNRFYDPNTGRFTQEDPIGLAGGINLYGYAAGDPVNYSDPFGLSACDPPETSCPDIELFEHVKASLQQLLTDLAVASAQVYASIGNAVVPVGDVATLTGGDPTADGTDRAIAAGSLIFGLGVAKPGAKVTANLARTLRRAQGADVTVSNVGRFFRATWEVAGEEGGQSRTVWVKDIAPDGRTVRMYHDSYNRGGVFQHRKFKVPE